MTIESSVAVPTSQTVGHSESMITSLTGRALLNEMPRSPWSVWRTYLTNWTNSGSPTPNRSSSEAICDGGQVAAAEQVVDRVVVDDAEQEEVERQDERQRGDRSRDLAEDESQAHGRGRCYSRSSWLARRRTAKNPPIASRATAPAATAIHSAVLLPPLEPSPVGVRLT